MKELLSKMNEENGILSKLKSKKAVNVILALGLLGIFLIFLSTLIPEKNKSSNTVPKSAFSAQEYVDEMERKLAEMISSIEGAGACRVMVTLENGVEYVYAREEDINTDRKEDGNGISERDDKKESVIIVDSGNGRQGLLVTEIQPTVRGVVVVCQGGDQPIVQERVINLVTTALNISSKRVCVTKSSD